MVIIKKYPNRRLYDTSRSQYINVEDLKQMVLEHKEFQVVDSKSGQDLTKSLLLQIISEQESNEHQSLLTNTLLKQLICFYGSDMNPMLRTYLEQSLGVFVERQEAVKDMMDGWLEMTPMGGFKKLFESVSGVPGGSKSNKDNK